MENEYTVEINTSAGIVWNIMGTKFDRVGDWATAVDSSQPVESDELGARSCTSSTPGLSGAFTEILTEFSDEERFFSYVGDVIPSYLKAAGNHWFVRETGPESCVAGFSPTVEFYRGTGWILGFLFTKFGSKVAAQMLNDLKVFAETGEPSEAKKRVMSKSSK